MLAESQHRVEQEEKLLEKRCWPPTLPRFRSVEHIALPTVRQWLKKCLYPGDEMRRDSQRSY